MKEMLLPDASAHDHPGSLDLTTAARQYLAGLKRSGVETLPSSDGRHTEALETLLQPLFQPMSGMSKESVEREPATAQPALVPPTLSQPKSSVAESAVPYQVPAQLLPSDPISRRPQAQPSDIGPGQGVDTSDYPESLPLAQRRTELTQIADTVGQCRRCSELAQCRTRTVFGVGNIAPRLVFLGEAPGADEDRAGEPFVGAAGQLLNKIIAACGMKREDVYILNTIKCRPPGNRNPDLSELENCWEYTRRQIEILRPEFICCLGLIATKQLLKTTLPLGRLRQKFHSYRGSRVVVTYHPAYLLRTESAKKHVWDDMKMLLKEMGIDLTK